MRLGFSWKHLGWSKVELALFLALPVTVVAFTMGSSSVSLAVRIGHDLRWVTLVILAGIAVVFGWSSYRRAPKLLVAVVAALGTVGLLSATWSVMPRVSAERAVSFLLLTLVATFIAVGATVDRRRIEGVMVALLAAPVLIALAGLVLLASDHSLAVQSANIHMPERMRGFGEDPNTVSMLFAFALPIAVWLLVSSRSSGGRLLAGAAALLLYGSVLASGSRGAILASAAGVVIFVLVRTESIRLLVPVIAVLVVFFVVTYELTGTRASLAPTTSVTPAASTTPSTNSTTPTSTSTSTSTSVSTSPGAIRTSRVCVPTPTPASSGSRFDVQLIPDSCEPIPFPPEQEEIGYPGLYGWKPILAYGSGRVYVWLEAIREGLQRPLLGYGFGTEQYVFFPRSYIFEGEYTENSFVGMFLQLGAVGVLLLLVPFVIVAITATRVVARRRGLEREIIAVGAATTTAGFVIAFFQSYLYSVGNVATLTCWIVIFLTVAVSSTGLKLGAGV